MEVLLEYNSTKIKLDISKINDWNSLNQSIRTIFKLNSEKELEIYTLPNNTYLMESNFDEEFIKVKKNIKSIIIQDVVDLAEKIKNIGIPINQIEDDEEDPNKGNAAKSIIFNKKQNIFKDKCSLCKDIFGTIKYGCLLCPNYFLCNKCEENHPHPMIKYKSNSLSDNVNKILDMRISQYMKENEYADRLKNKYKLKALFMLGLRTNISSNSFSMGSNQTREINLLIRNSNGFSIPKNTLNIFIKNQYDLKININDEALHKDISPNFEVLIKITIKSSDKNLLETYNLKIETISNKMDIISRPINLKITIKNDEEDNVLNQQFNEFPSIVLLPKEKKQKLQYIIKEKLSIKTPSEIKAIMEKFKWNIDDAISDLVV